MITSDGQNNWNNSQPHLENYFSNICRYGNVAHKNSAKGLHHWSFELLLPSLIAECYLILLRLPVVQHQVVVRVAKPCLSAPQISSLLSICASDSVAQPSHKHFSMAYVLPAPFQLVEASHQGRFILRWFRQSLLFKQTHGISRLLTGCSLSSPLSAIHVL